MTVLFPPFAHSVSAYVERLPQLLSPDAFGLNGTWASDGDFAKNLQGYAKRKPFGFFAKTGFIKKCVSAFRKELPFPLKNLRFPFDFRANAYMTDSGDLSLSLGLIQTNNFYRLNALLLHELSHLILSAQKEYEILLALDKAFLNAYPNEKAAPVLSPVELYATALSTVLLRASAALLEEKDKAEFERQANLEEEKLKRAYAEFSAAQTK